MHGAGRWWVLALPGVGFGRQATEPEAAPLGQAPRTSVRAHDSNSFTMAAKSFGPSPSALLAL